MKSGLNILWILVFLISCGEVKEKKSVSTINTNNVTAKDILGNSNYPAICYGGYRNKTRDIQPTIEELKTDMKILSAMGIRIVRTYNVHLDHSENLLKAINELQKEDKNFEMYVMLGAWIDCKNAWTELPLDHHKESERNEVEIKEAVRLANLYPNIVKIVAVGNEAMVKWATEYYVQPNIILKWVNHLQNLKKEGKLNKDLWITTSDNFASWGGGSNEYHTDDLNKLIAAVDYISMHTYPMHDTHYNPKFWKGEHNEHTLSNLEDIEKAMQRSLAYAQSQYQGVKNYMERLGIHKPIHIGETGWASTSNEFYGPKGANATDELKQGMYYKHMRDWTEKEQLSCFYFEAFDEPWKNAQNPAGSENHFGLFTVDGKAKYALWHLVDEHKFEGLRRDGNKITKTFNGDKQALINSVLPSLVNH
ncbi:glycosyl hydrolase family 17 protein [Tenacibaculum tangerinum]|uniref:Endo-1,3-beta-glucanase btgC n=1 Tax=Tenacibaculum tangerinum TaxID=3038772 RepID=A0ABY8L3P1_9FLAO|nr:glycosyl hydrolase family 17 protein [Tenacibaculum tangerinum]WGH76047.1 glycosyl hydrolase family 17 protein [Tenacibaculum tangerinum]